MPNNDHNFSSASPHANHLIDQPKEIKPEDTEYLDEERDREKYHERKGE